MEDVEDLIRQLRQHPEWRDTLRREILSEELLSLPQVVRELAQAQVRTEARLETLTARVDALTARVEELAQAEARTEARLETLAARVEELAQAQARTEGRLGMLVGRFFEWEYAGKAPAYFDDLLRRSRVLPWSEVAELLDLAGERLGRDERKEILAADLVLLGRRVADQAETYALGEVSVGIGLEDVRRAAKRARILAGATSKAVIPVVAGQSILPEARELARELGVSVFLDGGLQAE